MASGFITMTQRPRRLFKMMNGQRVWMCNRCRRDRKEVEAKWYRYSYRREKRFLKVKHGYDFFFVREDELLCDECYLIVFVRDEL